MSLLITKIQSYSIHDGPGIRTTVFFKGCTLRCPWCANPETQSVKNEPWFDESKCIAGKAACTFNPSCSGAAEDVPLCKTGALSMAGREYSCQELEAAILRDAPFWKNGGGVTFSGGEPLLFIKEYEPLLNNLKSRGVSIFFETALNAPSENAALMLSYAAGIYCDMKTLRPEDFRSIGDDMQLYKSNLNLVDSSGIPYIIRIPLIKPYTYNEENLDKIGELLPALHPQRVEIFSCHNLAEKKYKMLGRKFTPCNNVASDELDYASRRLSESGKPIKILKLG